MDAVKIFEPHAIFTQQMQGMFLKSIPGYFNGEDNDWFILVDQIAPSNIGGQGFLDRDTDACDTRYLSSNDNILLINQPNVRTAISSAKKYRNGNLVEIVGHVTARIGDSVYIQDDEYGAIKTCLGTTPLPEESQLVTVIGFMSEESLIRQVIKPKVEPPKPDQMDNIPPAPKAVFMKNCAVAGTDISGQKGRNSGIGLNNVSLLISTAGKVIQAGSGYFKISDGSMPEGLKISSTTSVTVDNFVTVTGISSIEVDNDGIIKPVILARKGTDVRLEREQI